jgi:hypothetical protein
MPLQLSLGHVPSALIGSINQWHHHMRREVGCRQASTLWQKVHDLKMLWIEGNSEY